MKILGISGGSKNGTNDAMTKEALMGAKEEGAEIEFIHLLDLNLKPCNGCVQCVAGKTGIAAGGHCNCILKDDFLWLEDKFYDADGVIFGMPIFEKGFPGFFKALQDRLAGPSHDIGILTAARKIREMKGITEGKGPDPRAFKKRFATFMSIGGSEWVCRAAADFYLFGMVPMLETVDNLVFDWAKNLIMDDARVAKIREAGRALVRAAKNPDKPAFRGEPGICSNCHSRLMYLNDEANRVECSVCGIIGELKIEDGKVRFEFPPEQLEHAHNLIPGKMIHVQDVANNEKGFAELKKTDEFKRRREMYKAFIAPSVPARA